MPLSPGLYERVVVSAEDVGEEDEDVAKGVCAGRSSLTHVRAHDGRLQAEGEVTGALTDAEGESDDVRVAIEPQLGAGAMNAFDRERSQ